MPTTRKKVIKTVYKDEDDSEAENAAGDFSDSGSEAEIPQHSSSEEDIDEEENDVSSADEIYEKSKKKQSQAKKQFQAKRKPRFAKQFISKINRQSCAGEEEIDVAPTLFSIKDLSEADKLLPAVLNLSESDSSEDEAPKAPSKKQTPSATTSLQQQSDSENESPMEYKDVWSQNVQDNSEEVAKKTFMELEQHKAKIDETKASLLKYQASTSTQEGEVDIKNLLAQGEEVLPEPTPEKKGRKVKKARDDSDSEMEDWEEVKEAKSIPQQGLQFVVDFPDAVCRKTKKKLDIEMMMKRKINRVKKEYQVYMHKVHVLCWLGHGNHISRVLNDQEILAAALSLVPSKECYPGERVDMKYLEQITTWYKDKLALNQDKNENKFRPKAPPLKDILLGQIKGRTVTAKKYLVFIFVSMLRAIGLQCRVMFNFVTLPIKPPSSELCSLSTKPKDEKKSISDKTKAEKSKDNDKKKITDSKSKSKQKIPQVDGNDDSFLFDDGDVENISQLDGNDDTTVKPRSTRARRAKNKTDDTINDNQDVSPPKRARKCPSPKTSNTALETLKVNKEINKDVPQKRKRAARKDQVNSDNDKSSLTDNKIDVSKPPGTSNREENKMEVDNQDTKRPSPSARKTRNTDRKVSAKATGTMSQKTSKPDNKPLNPPKITVTNDKNETNISSKYFENQKTTSVKSSRLSLSRNRSQTANPSASQKTDVKTDDKVVKLKLRTKSAPGTCVETSKYFTSPESKPEIKSTRSTRLTKKEEAKEDMQRVSHRDLAKSKVKPKKNDIKDDLVNIIKKRVKEAKDDSKQGKVKAKIKQESDEDSDYLLEEAPKRRNSESDDEFKPTKINPRPSTSRKKIDRRVLSTDSEETPKNKCDVWCEVFVEELEQWVAVDVIRAKVHCMKEIYDRATHPVCYVVGWDNNNYLKDLTRRYVPHWNTVTRKQRAEPAWWETAIKPWLGPKSARDREEDEQLNRMQLEAPLPKSIAEYKNHPLYALKRHLLKFEVIYPPDAATLGFVRNEPVYARECVYVCRSRDTWLKEAKVVRLGEQPYKVVKARPKWDKLSNKLITDKPLEVFGPWQVQDYEPPVAENGIVPRNAYGNVELFKDCMLPKGTVHIKLPGLNRVAKKLNIDCAPAMTGFEFNGGWSHPVYDGFVVCKEFEEVITEAWLKDQEEQERRELEKLETRVYGNWKRLIKGLLIRERLKAKYGFDDPPAPAQKKNKGPKLVVKKR